MMLVLGSNGFVGGHIAARARAAGLPVLSAARTARPQASGWPGLDLATAPAAELERALRAALPDVVVNCAGATVGDPARLAADNVVSVARLLAAMTRALPRARLVHIGSAAEYGVVKAGKPVRETARPRPVDAYGLTKLAGTELVRAAAAGGLDAIVLRVFNLVGPGTPAATLPGRLVADLRRAGPDEAVATGPLGAFRDFVDVRDVADAAVAATVARGTIPVLLNIGSGRAIQLREIAAALAELSGGGRIAEQAQAAGSPRSAAVPWQQAQVSRAARVLHWSPAISLTTSLRDMWDAAGCGK
jgi:nucleoside-diphosphate-sugar epimerase